MGASRRVMARASNGMTAPKDRKHKVKKIGQGYFSRIAQICASVTRVAWRSALGFAMMNDIYFSPF